MLYQIFNFFKNDCVSLLYYILTKMVTFSIIFPLMEFAQKMKLIMGLWPVNFTLGQNKK